MDGRQLTIALFRNGAPPGVLRLEEPLRVYPAELTGTGALYYGALAVPSLREIDALCRLMVEAGMEDGALQVRTSGGVPVCFLASIHQMAAEPGRAQPLTPPQIEMELSPC